MNFHTLNISSQYRSSGTIDDFVVTFPWPLAYSPESIKVLSVIVPTFYTNLRGNVAYVTSDIVAGIDNGYFPVNNPTIVDSVIAVVSPHQNYQNSFNDPCFITRGTKFGMKQPLPQPDRTLAFSLKNMDGTLVGAQDEWNITIICYATITQPSITTRF
jgi:hypothetical protein